MKASAVYRKAAELIDAQKHLERLNNHSCCMISYVRYGKQYRFGRGKYLCKERGAYIAMFGPQGSESAMEWGGEWRDQERVLALLLMADISRDEE
jgi:hypothetical protein